jgi:hypothetical protein
MELPVGEVAHELRRVEIFPTSGRFRLAELLVKANQQIGELAPNGV